MTIRCKDLQRITGKSERQCYRDLKIIKSAKFGASVLVTKQDVSNFYGLSIREIDDMLNKKKK